MLRMAAYTGFFKDTLVLRDMMPVHRSGYVIWLCNYSSAERIVYTDYSSNGIVWTNQNITAGARQKSGTGVIVVPRGIVGGGIILPDAAVDSKYIRLRLDATADGDGVFAQLETAAPIPEYPLMSWA